VIPVIRPWLGEEEAEAAAAVVRSGWVAQGPRVVEFEQAFADSAGAGHGVAVSSCTTGLHLAMYLLGIKAGDVVLIKSRHGAVQTIVQPDSTLRRGVVTLTHGFGGDPSDPNGGANVNLLLSHDERDPITGIPRMSNIPVALLPYAAGSPAQLCEHA